MKNEIKLNTIVWVSLIGLILASFFIAENKISNLTLMIAAISIVKFMAVIFQFVETKHAHLIWKTVSILFIICYLFILLALG
jgi:hypothetical protein